MTWCNDCSDVQTVDQRSSPPRPPPSASSNKIVVRSSSIPERHRDCLVRTCPSCGHQIKCQDQQGGVNDLPGLPAGVKFDPTDQELLEHLEAKVRSDACRLHPLLDEFIPSIEGENGICYTHPEKLPGVNKDGLVRHFFHRPSRAYTTGTRKRRKVHTDAEGGETRWHKTGKTRPVLVGGKVKGYKKILVLYTNYGKQRKPEKTNWVMHQYHLGHNEEERDGELVVSKVFYQTQPRQCGSAANHLTKQKGQIQMVHEEAGSDLRNTGIVVQYYTSNNSSFMSFDHQAAASQSRANPTHLLPHFSVHDAPFIP